METHVTFVLDSSGSMAEIEDDTKGGFNVFLRDQQEEEGSATVSLYEFDTNVDLIYENRSVEEAPKLTNENYKPSGRTALHDAIAQAVDETIDSLETLDETEQPENVIVVILTDGKENASETPQQKVRERVENQRDQQNWEFLFIGANQDAALTADKMGINQDNSLNMSHSGEGAQEAYRSTSESIRRARQEGTTGGYTNEDRQRQKEVDNS